jgi:threonine synthase
MKYRSTRGKAPAVGLGAAINAGLAPDGGLHVPETLPQLPSHSFDADDSLARVAARLLAPFFDGDDLAAQLEPICADAFAFPAPLKPLAGTDDYLLELFHGPTAAFKDFGARFLAACMQRMPRASSQAPTTILVATSGDTGAAVAAAFARLAHFHVVILYPDGRVSPRQAHQLGCFGGNVSAMRVAGSFDDCQAMV